MQQQAFYIQQKEETYIEKLKENEQSKAQIVLDWATFLEVQIVEGNYTEPKFTIAAHISKIIEENNIDISTPWIYATLPERFVNRQMYTSSTTRKCIHSPSADISEIEKADNSKLIDTYEQVKKEVQDSIGIKKQARDRLDFVVKQIHERGLKVPNLTKRISNEKPVPKQTLAYDAMEDLITMLKHVQQKLEEYPPTDEHDRILADAIESFTNLFEGFDDDKYAKCMVDWFKITADNYEKSHRAAAKHNATSIEIDGKLVTRKLTHEQITDKAPEIALKAYDLSLHIPILAELVRWYREVREPVTAMRRYRVGPKLSEQA